MQPLSYGAGIRWSPTGRRASSSQSLGVCQAVGLRQPAARGSSIASWVVPPIKDTLKTAFDKSRCVAEIHSPSQVGVGNTKLIKLRAMASSGRPLVGCRTQ